MSKQQLGTDYLAVLTPWNGRGGFSLDEIRRVLKRLGDPQDSYPNIHIAGTNGKGSVSSATASILGAAGYKVGLNTSPHLQAVNERIVVDGLPISDECLGEFAYDIRNAAAKEGIELSFHEAITAVSFLALRELGVEWGVIEVGLGGRLDASNVISRPSATAIVTIDYDHQQILGDSLAQIAGEKAGIIKPGSPVIIGSLPREAEIVVLQKARGQKVYLYGSDYGVSPKGVPGEGRFGYWGKDFPRGKQVSFDFTSPLLGKHQGHNLAVAATLGLAVGIEHDLVRKGIESVYWPARLETVAVDGVQLLMDCAHNPAGIRAFVDYLQVKDKRAIDLTFGVLDTKNWQEMIGILAPFVSHWRLVLPDSERALPLSSVEREIRVSGNDIRVTSYGDQYQRLLKDLLDNSTEGTRFVTGSMYMIGKIRQMLSLPSKPLWQRGNIKQCFA